MRVRGRREEETKDEMTVTGLEAQPISTLGRLPMAVTQLNVRSVLLPLGLHVSNQADTLTIR